MCLWRVSSENSLVELDFLKALSSQRWIECKICKALWKIAGERVKENGCMGRWRGGPGLWEYSYITKSYCVVVTKGTCVVDLFFAFLSFKLQSQGQFKGHQSISKADGQLISDAYISPINRDVQCRFSTTALSPTCCHFE